MIISREKGFEVLVILLIFINIGTLINYSNVLVDKISIILSMFILLLVLTFCIGKIKKSYCVAILINLFSLLLTFMIHSGLGVCGVIGSLLLSIMVFNNVSITLSFYRKLHCLVAIVLCLYVSSVDSKFCYTGIVYDFFGNDLNINMWGLLILAAVLHLICFYDSIKIKTIFSASVISCIMIYLSYLLFMSRCRTAMIAYIVFWILRFTIKSYLTLFKYRCLVSIILLFSLVFPLFYLYLYITVDNFAVLGKNIFTGREIVWLEAINQYLNYPILGSGNDFVMLSVNDSYTQSAHNMLLGILKSCGIIPTFTIVFFAINKMYSTNLEHRMVTAQIAFISAMTCSFFESFLMDSHLYVFYLLFLLSNIKVEREFKYDT